MFGHHQHIACTAVTLNERDHQESEYRKRKEKGQGWNPEKAAEHMAIREPGKSQWDTRSNSLRVQCPGSQGTRGINHVRCYWQLMPGGLWEGILAVRYVEVIGDLNKEIYWWAIQSLVGVSSRDKWDTEVKIARTNTCNEVWCKKERNGAMARGERELCILNEWRHGLCLCGWIWSLRLGKIGDARGNERIAVGKRRWDVIYNWRGGLHLEAQTVLL